jgi:hypothetical protein
MELCLILLTMPAKFKHHLPNNLTVIIHAYDIMLRIVIFTLDAIFHIWSSSLDMFLVRVYSRYNKKFTGSTDQTNFEKLC